MSTRPLLSLETTSPVCPSTSRTFCITAIVAVSVVETNRTGARSQLPQANSIIHLTGSGVLVSNVRVSRHNITGTGIKIRTRITVRWWWSLRLAGFQMQWRRQSGRSDCLLPKYRFCSCDCVPIEAVRPLFIVASAIFSPILLDINSHFFLV